MQTTGLLGKNVTIGTHRTSIRLEPAMWDALKEMSKRENVSIHVLCTCVHERKPAHISLTAAVRVFIMHYFYSAATERGHTQAQHGTLRNDYNVIIQDPKFISERMKVASS